MADKRKMKLFNERDNSLIDTEMDEWVNTRTGEQRVMQNVEKVYYGQRQFWKLYMQDFLAVLGIFESKQLEVVCYIMENTDPSTNLFIGTMTNIAREIGVSPTTVNNAIQRLKGANFMVVTETPSVYRVNPDIMVKGSEAKKRGLVITYTEDKNRALPEDSDVERAELAREAGESEKEVIIVEAEVSGEE